MSRIHGFFVEIWKDPVWSKVISVAILGVAGIFLNVVFPDFMNFAESLLREKTAISNWILFVSVVVFLLLLFAAFSWSDRRKVADEVLTSSRWFDEIVRQIADCKSARIYLRGFAHPDQFRVDHRDALLKLMRILKKRMQAGADIEIVAYHYRADEKSGLDWLKAELGEDFKELDRIKIIRNQPVSNSSSMYLFDSGVLLYNERENSKRSYHLRKLGGTVVHHLLEKGYAAIRSAYK